jgi:LacI family repressor for deo operon, udp, cdd, tsx, nupC, and nupG
VAIDAAGVVVVNGRYAGSGIGYDAYAELVPKGLRVVLVNAVTPPCPVPSVTVDIGAGATMAVEHLAAMGHERIGCLVGPRRYVTAVEFASSWRTAMRSRGLNPTNDLLSETLFTIQGGQAGTAQLLEANATGIVAASDMMAIGAVRAVRSWGMTVPEDVSVVGCDGTTLASVADPALTTLRQPVGQIATAVASLFVNPPDLNGPFASQVFMPELVVAASTGPARHTVG